MGLLYNIQEQAQQDIQLTDIIGGLVMKVSNIKQHERYFNWKYTEGAQLVGRYDFPLLQAVNQMPHDLVPFHLAKYEKESACKWPHFYIEDYRFASFVQNAFRYFDLLKKFEGCIGPDCSMYMDMPKPQQIMNCWFNYAITYAMQSNGITTVPNACWGDLESLNWAFDGLPEDSILSLTTQGCLKNPECREVLLTGMKRLVKVKHPTALLVYGRFPEAWRDLLSVPITICKPYCDMKWGK
ncbi:MAG: DUF4417 domain-containing protein [Clostridia bacterium]|nr:DUF4417 domain-containing protein [Clostridia bacterium]